MFRDNGFKDETCPLPGEEVHRLLKRVERLRRLAGKYKRAEIIRDALLEISNISTEVSTPEDFYSGVHNHIRQLIAADNFFIATFNALSGQLEIPFFADEKDPHPAISYPDGQLHGVLMRGLTGYVFRTGKALLCNATTFAELIDAGEIVSLGSDCNQWLGVPIRHNEVTTGVIVVQSYDGATLYGETELELMEFISHHIAGVMERLKHQEQLEQAIEQRTRELSLAYDRLKQEVYERRRAERLQKSLYEIAELAASGLEQQDFYVRLHAIISHLLPANNCYIALVSDEEQRSLHFPFYMSQIDADVPPPRPLTDGLTEYLLKHGRPLLLNSDDIRALEQAGDIYAQAPELNKTQSMHQWIGVPLYIQDQVRGALTIYSLSANQNYQLRDLELLTFVSQHIGTAIERKLNAESLQRSYEQLEEKVEARTRALAAVNQDLQQEIQRRKQIEQQLIHDAHHDALTGLPNRSMFMERLAQAVKHVRRHGKDQFALLFIDLDRFKLINDTLGHLQGDRFLIETASRLKTCIRDNDTLGRLGGDEFVILLDAINHSQDAEEVSERILSELSRPFLLGNQEFQSGASIGIAISNQQRVATAESLLRDADAAMYQAKFRGKGCYVKFDDKAREALTHELELENELRQAMGSNALQLQFSPVSSNADEAASALALSLTWEHRDFGHMGANELRKLARCCNLELELDKHLIANLSQHAAALELPCHVQLASGHLKHKHALRSLKNSLKTLPLSKLDLWLFFDEKAMVQDTKNHISGLALLHKLGVKLGLSGFGTGVSPLNNLTLLPVSSLKLAESLGQSGGNPEQERLLQAMVAAANALGLTLIASGVEDARRWHRLQKLGIVLGQGKLFGTHPEGRIPNCA
ncbi:diguanylate cyclase domain-containing protein [Shewanella cyperi]|uniref:diguanylate cyclase domain-containing protein n=1 Tax=Shewanella cyperi TaxID=2814292 RepID=UPI001A9497EB|nr:diguanylate cyclase [Shewanella cyperi]QSX40559.1 diguanylate cyclase [Shewanella cyperi]